MTRFCPRFYLQVLLGFFGFLLTFIAVPYPQALAASASSLSWGSQPVSFLSILAVLALLPFAVILLTSFVRISVVLSILRSAIGTPQIPPTMVITGLALILTVYVMAPVGEKIIEAVGPALNNQSGHGDFSIGNAETLYKAAMLAKEPVREFLVKHSLERDRGMFLDLSRRMRPKDNRNAITDKDFLVVVPAFVIGELSAAFKIGFLIFIPFLVIDMVIANILLALGMHMLSPTTISLPFKLLLFVLVDGWYLLTQGLVLSYV